MQTASSMTLRQPDRALKPLALTLDAVEQWALAATAPLSADRLRVVAFWYLDYVLQQVPEERKTRYTMRLAQTECHGTAFGLKPALPDNDHALVGQDARELLIDRRFRDDIDRTALIDLLSGHVAEPAHDGVIVDQSSRDKYEFRARLFADEAGAVLQRKGASAIKGSRPNVLVIGATAGIIGALIDRGFDVAASDMSADVVGRSLGGVSVESHTENDRLIEAADLAIITGMTLANQTLPVLAEAAKTHNTSTMIWAITGKNLGRYYIEQGVDCVISDSSPFFLLSGPATLGVWRRQS